MLPQFPLLHMQQPRRHKNDIIDPFWRFMWVLGIETWVLVAPNHVPGLLVCLRSELFKQLEHFKTRVLSFLLMNCKCSLHIQNASLLLDKYLETFLPVSGFCFRGGES